MFGETVQMLKKKDGLLVLLDSAIKEEVENKQKFSPCTLQTTELVMVRIYIRARNESSYLCDCTQLQELDHRRCLFI